MKKFSTILVTLLTVVASQASAQQSIIQQLPMRHMAGIEIEKDHE
jgi:hypothetical protein